MTLETRINALIDREGGYVDHPNDRGGPTCWGITQAVAREHGYRGPMQTLPRDTAARIYRKLYWFGPALDKVDTIYPRVAEEMFDTGVNMGPRVAAKFLQRALNLLNNRGAYYADIAVDGLTGPGTLAALEGYRKKRGAGEGEAVLLWMMKAFRICRYAELGERDPTQEAFEYGWLARMVREAA